MRDAQAPARARLAAAGRSSPLVWAGLGVRGPASRPARPCINLLLLLVLLAAFLPAGISPAAAAPAGARGIAFPTYAYAIASGPYTYDVIVDRAGKERRVSRVAVAGVGLTDIALRISPDLERVAVRLNGGAGGGSSMRVIEIGTGRAITTTLRSNANEGVGAFAWSPDGKTLAYTLVSPQKIDAENGVGSVWVVSHEGKWPRKVAGAGADRLVGWSPDGTGVYVQRVSGEGDARQSSLYYQHLAGGEPRVLLTSRAPGKNDQGLTYRRFAISPALVPDAGIGAARVSALAAGDLSSVAGDAAATTKKGTADKAAAAALLVSDGGADYRAVQGEGVEYSLLRWSPNGYNLIASGGPGGKAWLVDANSGRSYPLPGQVNNLAPIAWTADARYALMAPPGGPATTLITLDTATGKLAASRQVGKVPVADEVAKSIPIPYINQVWDTNSQVSGVWACGPTSVAMVLASYGRLEPWPMATGATRNSSGRVSQMAGAEPGYTREDGRDYAQYITSPFKYKGREFTATSKDRDGRKVAGLYGSIVGADALAHWNKMIDVLKLYDLQPDYLPVTWGSITAAIDKGYPVLVGTTLTSDGHILVAKGYTGNGYLIVHDPYGNKWGPNGYGGPDGKNVAYPWRKLTARMALVVKGTVWTPTPTPTPTVEPTATPTETPVPTSTPEPTATPVPQ